MNTEDATGLRLATDADSPTVDPDATVAVNERALRELVSWIAECIDTGRGGCISALPWHRPDELPTCPAFRLCDNSISHRNPRLCEEQLLAALRVTR